MPPISSGAAAAPSRSTPPGATTSPCSASPSASARLWKEGKTLQQVKDIRRAEAERAGEALGGHDLVCLDMGDDRLEFTAKSKARIVEVIRKVQPAFMLSHSR